MLHNLNQQINIILICLFAGIICGFIFQINNKIKNKLKKNIISVFLDRFFTIFCGFLLIFLLNKYFYGYYYLIFFVVFICGLFLCKKYLTSSLDYFCKLLYTQFIKLRGKIKCKKKTQKNSPDSSLS